jgi:ABC-2 type transport system ATP-binding protein
VTGARLEATGLSKRYGDKCALDDFSISVRPGEIVALVGPNGAGKTTAVSLLSGVLPLETGEVWIDGIALHQKPRRAKERLGLLPQESAVYPVLSVWKNMLLVAELYGVADRPRAIRRRLREVGLDDCASTPVYALSQGMCRRLSFAMTLLPEPPILILDEPTSGVDVQSRQQMFDVLRETVSRGIAVLYTTHRMDDVEHLCQRAVVLDGGRALVEGTIGELIERHAVSFIEIAIGTERGDLLAQKVRALGAEIVVEQVAGTVRVYAPDPRSALPQVVGALEACEARPAAVRLVPASLETAFLSLTGRKLREPG